MTNPKLKKIEVVDEDWLHPPRIIRAVQDRAGQVTDSGGPAPFLTNDTTGLFKKIMRVSIAGLRPSGRTGQKLETDV